MTKICPETGEEIYCDWPTCDGCPNKGNDEWREAFQICCDCQYLGDKYSFPLPNNMIDMDENNPAIKHYYCCCGDCNQYSKDVSVQFIRECPCFDAL